MKIWLNDKRMPYLRKIIDMKAGPTNEELTCLQCKSGRAVWRCLDCCNKKPVCVLCCRNNHKQEIYHRVEKWNGRYFQKGALWQVGVKIYLGHDGKPCPRSAAALTGLSEYIQVEQNQRQTGDILNQVAAEMSIPMAEVLAIISDALENTNATMSPMGQKVLNVAAEKAGLDVLDLLHYLKSVISGMAEEQANLLQADSDRAATDAEATEGNETCEGILLEDDVGGDDDNWEDEDERKVTDGNPRFLPTPPPKDHSGNTFLTVVHANGYHSLPVVWCECVDRSQQHDLQLLDQHLYPASYERIKTVFTFACLDDLRYESLECKSSHYQYHNKLRRRTCPQCPEVAPNRYKELCRVARQWRNLKYRKWFWLLHNMNGKRGEMALFCAACPQDSVNLEPGWEKDQEANPYANQILFSHYIVE